MEERDLRLLTLAQIQRLGPRKLSTLVRHGGVDEVCMYPRRFADVLGAHVVLELESGFARKEAERCYDAARQKGQRLLFLGTPDYPKALAEIYDPPPVLFLRGSMSNGARRVAIVGSRGATGAGRSFSRDLARGLAASGIEVVSGLARGIDGAAHEGALAAPFSTIAVLGSSVDVIYPSEHQHLAGRIEANGAILSELPPSTGPSATHFPKRNRIIVGLSEAVIVVEAGLKSGALITARVALEEGRDVLAVPGRPSDPLAVGPNLLIRDGATLVQGLEDVLEHLHIASPSSSPTATGDPILEKLAHSSVKSIDELSNETGLPTPRLMARLSELELDGKIERLPGTLFRSASPA